MHWLMSGYAQSLWLYVDNRNLMLTQYIMTNGVTCSTSTNNDLKEGIRVPVTDFTLVNTREWGTLLE